MKSMILGMLLAAVIPTAMATETAALYVEESRQGETMDQFVLRVSPRAVAHSNKTGEQLCGAIVPVNDGEYRIAMHATESTTKCIVPGKAGLYFLALPYFAKPLQHPDVDAPLYQAHHKRVYYQDGPRARTVGKFAVN